MMATKSWSQTVVSPARLEDIMSEELAQELTQSSEKPKTHLDEETGTSSIEKAENLAAFLAEAGLSETELKELTDLKDITQLSDSRYTVQCF